MRIPMHAHRNAFTLIEMMVVMTLISGVMFGGVALIVAVRQTGGRVAAQHQNTRSLQTLASDFRRDLQHANGIQIDQSEVPSIAISNRRDQKITYSRVDQDLHRTVESEGAVTHREIYRFQTPIEVTWQVTPTWLEQRDGVTMAIQLARAPSKKVDPRSIQILGIPLQKVALSAPEEAATRAGQAPRDLTLRLCLAPPGISRRRVSNTAATLGMTTAPTRTFRSRRGRR